LSEKLPVLSGKEIVKALTKIGFVPVRQKSSHVFLRHADGRRTVIPLHDEVNKSTHGHNKPDKNNEGRVSETL